MLYKKKIDMTKNYATIFPLWNVKSVEKKEKSKRGKRTSVLQKYFSLLQLTLLEVILLSFVIY